MPVARTTRPPPKKHTPHTIEVCPYCKASVPSPQITDHRLAHWDDKKTSSKDDYWRCPYKDCTFNVPSHAGEELDEHASLHEDLEAHVCPHLVPSADNPDEKVVCGFRAVHPSILGQHREIYHRYPAYGQNAIDPSKDDCLTCIPLYFCTETEDHSAVTRSRLAREKMMEERARQLRQARKSNINAIKLVPLVAPPRSKQLDEPRSAPLVYLDPRKNTSQSNRWISEPATSPAPSSPAEQLLWDGLSMTSWTNSEPTSQWGNEFEDLFPSIMEDIEANSSCSASSIPDFLWDNIPLDPAFPPPVLDSSLDDLFMPDSNDMSDAERLFFPPKVLSPDELKAMGEELFGMIEQPVDQSISV